MSNSLLGFTGESLLNHVQWKSSKSENVCARLIVTGKTYKLKDKDFGPVPLSWQLQKDGGPLLIQRLSSDNGPLWIVQIDVPANSQHNRQFEMSPYTMARDTVGAVFREMQNFDTIRVSYMGKDADEFRGMVVGIEMSQYRFRNTWPKSVGSKKPSIYFETPHLKNAKTVFTEAKRLGEAVNLSRHLVNLPPNVLNPSTYADFCKELFKNTKVKVEVWNFDRLQKENMNLHAAVGQASVDKPCMVKLSYRGASAKGHRAFVGKGITFDSGGLDIKPASGMRDMKKDMGGSASVVALCYWAVHSRSKFNVEFYLALAENSVGANAFRPGDVLTSRCGKTVEIHNTDAEGRLVLADALTLAIESKPEWVIDVSTLTGAIKVAMGETTAGMFSNNDRLSEQILKCARLRGDNCWRSPLDPTQKNKLKSDVADLVNAHEGFGGAVTAALFLEAFVGTTPWAHFDIYSWVGSAGAAYSEKGGNGQTVQLLSQLL